MVSVYLSVAGVGGLHTKSRNVTPAFTFQVSARSHVAMSALSKVKKDDKMSENDNVTHCAGTTKVAVNVMGKNA